MTGKTKEPKDLWYKDGLRFTCTQCGRCCGGAPGYVWVNAAEITAMSQAMEMDEDSFCKKFVRQVGRRRSLVEYPDGDCIFLDPESRHCLVYEDRPAQCRTWPFWDSTLKTPEDWDETCEVCPGAGKGKLHKIEKIETARKSNHTSV